MTADAGPGGGRRPDEEPLLPLWDLVQTSHLAARRFTEVFAQAGLTPAQYGVLASLVDGDDLSQADLARAVLVRPASMARLVADMAEAGLVVRDGPGGRGRRTSVRPTERGRRAQAEARPRARAVNAPEALGLTAAEAQTLTRLLRKVAGRLSAAGEPADR